MQSLCARSCCWCGYVCKRSFSEYHKYF